ncbi:MAG: N4-gp56 family major capsid protein [Candidatus Peribacteraceae bacterium]|jgi:N4-gp56 family major capsid protein
MAQTIIGLNDAKAVKRYSGNLAVDVGRKGFWARKFMGKGEVPTKPIWQLTDLEAGAGEQITFDLSMQLNMQPIEGDAELHGKEEALQFYSDNVYIDQMRGGADAGGRMTRKRTLHDLRKIAKARETDWWGRVFDQIFFMYLSGARGTNSEYVFPTTYTGFGNNSFTSPDTNHIVYGGTATSKASITATDTMSTLPIDRAVAYANMMGGGGPVASEVPQLQKCNIDGEDVFLCVMDGYQAYNFRRNTTSMDWADIQKALLASVGKNNEFFKGGLGIWNGVVLQQHQNCIRYTDYGSGAIEATRALFCGLQAAVVAFGSPGQDLRFGWNEETRDNGNKIIISTHTIFGVKKTTFNGNDFGVMAIDTASTKP